MEMESVSIIAIAKVIWKRLWIVVVSAIVCAVVALGYCLLLAQPMYSASSTVLFASGVLFKDENTSLGNGEYITTGELSTTFALMKSFSGILLKSTDYYKEALSLAEAKGLNRQYTSEGLRGATSVSYEDDAVFVTITVTVADKDDAVTLISALSEAAPMVITGKIGRTSADILNVDASARKVSPNTLLMTLVALFAGTVVSDVIIVVVDRFDKTIKGEEDLLLNHELPLLGVVPLFESAKKKGRFSD